MVHTKKKKNVPLTEGSIARGLIAFAVPIFLGQLLQQLYNVADTWVIGNFASNDAFAAVSSSGSIIFFITGFFGGIGVGGGVIISKYFGAGDNLNVQRAIHTNFLFGLLASVLSTFVGVVFTPIVLRLMGTPDSVLPYSITYFRIYFGGVATVIMYNICMSIMRAEGDSIHPLYYLIFSSVVNVALDLIFVAVFKWGVAGAAIATVISQGLSVILCIIRMVRDDNEVTRLSFKKLHFHKSIMREVLQQGLPTGIQNSVISIGNMVIQSNINSFGAFAMSGQGAYAKVEGFVFLPITAISMALPTFISQNLGAGKYDRAKKGAAVGIASGMVLAELIGVVFYFFASYAIRFFVDSDDAVAYGVTHAKIVSLFFFLLAFSHCAAGVMRGCGKSFVPMLTMLTFWCAIRIVYVTIFIKLFPIYNTIAWAYPLTWTLSSIVFLIFLLKSDWVHSFDKKPIKQ
jgi:putative MATE family efflux protein